MKQFSKIIFPALTFGPVFIVLGLQGGKALLPQIISFAGALMTAFALQMLFMEIIKLGKQGEKI